MGCEMYLKFASGRGTETVVFIVMSLALISSVQIQCDVSVGVLARAWPTSRMPNGRSLYKNKISFISRLNPIISFEMYLEKHFLPIAERIAAFRTTGTGRMKVMVISGLHFFQNMSVDVKGLFRLWWLSQDAWLKKLRCYLKDFAGDKALAVVAFDAKLTLIIFLAVRESIPGWYQTKNTFVTKGPSERNHSSY